MFGTSRVQISARKSAILTEGFPRFLQANAGVLVVPQNQTTTASLKVLSNSTSTYHPIFRSYVDLVTEKESYNKLQINTASTLTFIY